MGIKVTPSTSGNKPATSFELFAGRVLAVEELTETRNHSDTLDYTDNRSTLCTYALVWLGTHGVPPKDYSYSGRTMAAHESLRDPNGWKSEYDAPPRDLEFWEQFAWVDCTNLFTWRGSDHMAPTVDADPANGGNPLMWANYVAWKSYQASLVEKALRDAAAAAQARKEAAAAETAKRAAKAAKSDAQKAEVEARMLKTPEKGATCTVDGFTGKVFWKGVKLYRGKWRGTVALKDAKGLVAWIDVSHWVPEATQAKAKKNKKEAK